MKTQRALSDEQERVRVEGLRILARIIARHALAHPVLHDDGPREEEAEPPPPATRLLQEARRSGQTTRPEPTGWRRPPLERMPTWLRTRSL